MTSLSEQLEKRHAAAILDARAGSETNGSASPTSSASLVPLDGSSVPVKEKAQSKSPEITSKVPSPGPNGGEQTDTAESRENSQDSGRLPVNKLEGFNLPQLGAASASSSVNGQSSENGSQSPLPTLRRGSRPSWIDEVSPQTNSAAASPASRKKTKTELLTLTDVGDNVGEVVLEIQRRLSGIQIEASKSAGVTGPTTFMIRGRPEDITVASDELRGRLGPHGSKTIYIPVQSRSSVLGPKGQALRQLELETHTKIVLGTAQRRSDWDIETLDITVSGSESSLDKVHDQLQTRAERFVTVSRILPTSNMETLLLETTPMHSRIQTESYKRKDGSIILELKGNWFEHLYDAITSIDAQIEKFEAEFITEKLQNVRMLSQAQLDDVITSMGDKSMAVLSPEGIIYGQKDSVTSIAKKINDIVASQVQVSLDISRAHQRNLDHARLLTKYFKATKELDDLEERLNVRILPPEGSQAESHIYEIVGDAGSTSLAKTAIVGRVNALKPAALAVIGPLTVPVTRTAAKNAIKTLKVDSVTAVLGDDELFIAYESDDDFGASDQDMADAVRLAFSHFAEVTELARNILTREVRLSEVSDIKYFRDPLGDEARELAKQVLDPVKVSIEQPEPKLLVLSGKRSDVGKAAASIPEIIELSKKHARKASYMEELQFDNENVRKLIGRSGSQISKIRSQFPDVKIEIGDAGKIRLTGIEADVKAARSHINDIQKRLRDETSIVLKIPTNFHALLIGQKGKNVRRLSEKYDCIIRFPREDGAFSSASTPDSESTGIISSTSNGSAGSSASSSSIGGGEDAITIRGPSKGVSAIKKEFLEVVEYEKAISYSEKVKVPSSILSRVIGRHGARVNAIMSATGVQINIGNDTDEEDGEVDVVIIGEKQKVHDAKSQLSSSVQQLLDHVEKEIEVEKKFHRYLTGPGNSIRRKIVQDAGGEIEPWNPRTLAIPPSSVNSSTIKISGPSKVVDAIEKRILEIVEEQTSRSRFTNKMKVPQLGHRLVVGPGGTTKREIEDKFNVQIHVPRADGKDESITIQGSDKDSVDKAEAYISELVSTAEFTVDVPLSVDSDLWAKGAYARRIANEYGVRLSRDDAPANGDAKPAINGSKKRPDRPDDIKQYAFIKETTSVAAGGPKRLWRISAKDEAACNIVKKEIEEQSASLTKAWLWLLETGQYKQLVGRGGSTINGIRSSTGCTITIPPVGSPDDEPVVLQGSSDQVDNAKAELLRAVGI